MLSSLKTPSTICSHMGVGSDHLLVSEGIQHDASSITPQHIGNLAQCLQVAQCRLCSEM